ncbi:MAG: hypothetical protein JSV54_06420 [Chloroflexota bacterium]|nr:MAG: hypothetical protein JSV54_06420 [Chloroflexota bacterium]
MAFSFNMKIAPRAMTKSMNILSLLHEPHQQFRDSDLIEGGVWVAFKDVPDFILEWDEEYEEEGDMVRTFGVLLDITSYGLIFALDNDPLRMDWKADDYYFRQALVPWHNIIYISAKHAT